MTPGMLNTMKKGPTTPKRLTNGAFIWYGFPGAARAGRPGEAQR